VYLIIGLLDSTGANPSTMLWGSTEIPRLEGPKIEARRAEMGPGREVPLFAS